MATDDLIAALDNAHRRALFDHVSRLKHDLGKYVSLRVRWLSDDAGAAERRDALTSDLLATRHGPDGVQGAVSVWDGFRPALVGQGDLDGGLRVDLSDDPEVVRLDRAMAIVSRVAGALDAVADTAGDLAEGEAAAREVADACRTLYRRVRVPGGDARWPTS